MGNVKFIDKYPDEPVRALSIKQPFASLMLHGKDETRVWNSKYFGWVLLCASQVPYSFNDLMNISGLEQIPRILSLVRGESDKVIYYDHYKDYCKSTAVLGKAIAIGRLNSVQHMKDYSHDSGSIKYIEKKCFVKYSTDLYMHEYTDVQPIVPFDWKGTLGWRTLDEETKSKIILL